MSAKILPFRRPAPQAQDLPADLSDEALLAACATGDTAALGALFERFHTSVYRVLCRLVGATSAELDDLVQATFLEVLRAAKGFQRRSSVRTYILGIATNVARHHYRGQKRRAQLAEHVSHLPGPVERGPDQSAARSEFLVRLADELDRLPHDLRVAFVMCDLEDVPGVEVARVLSVPEGTLWRRLHEARRALRRALEERGP